jgi:hypothetical protein
MQPELPPDVPSTENLLGQDLALPDTERFKQAILRQTTRYVRDRRRLRQARFVSAFAACYLAGMLTVYFGLHASAEPQLVEKPRENEPLAGQGAEKPEFSRGGRDISESTSKHSALAMEWQAADAEDNKSDLYRQAAERYQEKGDYVSALRCFENSLNVGSEADQELSVNDDWLLMALKEARQREKNHAKRPS